MRAIVCWVLAGCGFQGPPTSAQQPGLDAPQGSDAHAGDLCLGPGNFQICIPAPTQPVMLGATNSMIDTEANSTASMCVASNNAAVCVVAGTTVQIGGGILYASGHRPLVIFASDAIAITGGLDVGSHQMGPPDRRLRLRLVELRELQVERRRLGRRRPRWRRRRLVRFHRWQRRQRRRRRQRRWRGSNRRADARHAARRGALAGGTGGMGGAGGGTGGMGNRHGGGAVRTVARAGNSILVTGFVNAHPVAAAMRATWQRAAAAAAAPAA